MFVGLNWINWYWTTTKSWLPNIKKYHIYNSRKFTGKRLCSGVSLAFFFLLRHPRNLANQQPRSLPTRSILKLGPQLLLFQTHYHNITMPNIPCGYPTCTYTTGELPSAAAAAALNSHTAWHAQQQSMSAPAKVEKVPRPTLDTICTTEDWSYFESRWI